MALRELLAQFGIEVDTEKLDAADKKISTLIDNLKKVGTAMVGAYAVHQIYAFAEATAAAMDRVDDTAAALGISTDAVQTWGFAAKAAGDDAGELLNMMGRLQVTASAKDGGPAAEAFKKLGVSAKDATGKVKDADVLFGDVAEGFKNIDDPAKRAALATELFGRQGRKLLPFLIEGRDGVARLKHEFTDLGGGFDTEAIKKGAEFQHSMARVSVVVDGLNALLAKGVFPVLGWIADRASDVGGWFVRIAKNTNVVRNLLIALTAYLLPTLWSLAAGMWAAFAPLAPAAVVLGAIFLLFDELVTLFEGGDTVIGDSIDAIFGKGTTAANVQAIKDAWGEVKAVFVELWPYVKQVYEAMKWLVENTAKVSGGIGDWAAKHDNAVVEQRAEASGEIKRGRAGLTFEQNATAMNAQSYLEAQNRGEDMTKWQPPNTKAGVSREEVLAAVKQWIPVIQSDQRYADFQPRTYGPSPENPVAAGEVHVHVEGSTNMNEPQLQRAVAKGVNDARQSANRAAKHVLTQAGQKP